MNQTYLEAPIATASSRDAGDLIGACLGAEVDGLLLDEGALPAAFFDLSSGVAGDFAQRIVNYGLRAAAVVPDPAAHSASFQDFARESARSAAFRFFRTRQDAIAWLSAPR